MMELTEEIIGKERKFDGVVIDVEHWQVRLPDGKTSLREIALHKGAAAVIPVDGEGRVAMVRQFRTPVGRVMLEIPAGKLDYVGEDPLDCAKRELREETGLAAGKWRKLVALRTTPGFCNETIHLYMAQQLSQGERELDEDEFLNVEWMPLESIAEKVLSGEIEDAKTISAVMMAWEIYKRERA
jgi:ADP-ribose pyrophosphatase